MPKPFYQSRTLIFNAICAALAACEAAFNLLQPLLPMSLYALLAFVLPVGNAVLRVLTTVAVTAAAGASPATKGPADEQP